MIAVSSRFQGNDNININNTVVFTKGSATDYYHLRDFKILRF